MCRCILDLIWFAALFWWPAGAEAELSAEEKKKLKHKKKREVRLGGS